MPARYNQRQQRELQIGVDEGGSDVTCDVVHANQREAGG